MHKRKAKGNTPFAYIFKKFPVGRIKNSSHLGLRKKIELFNFFYLIGMPCGMGRNHQNKLVNINCVKAWESCVVHPESRI
jgi:hypothetical protein